MSKSDGKIIAIKFNLPIVGDVSGNVSAFTITGEEYLYTDGPNYNGPLQDKSYEISSVVLHPTETNTIQLIIKDTTPFNSVVGILTVVYDQSKGTLTGTSGIVENFEEIFTPNELNEQSNPGIREYVNAIITGTISLLEIEKIKIYETEYISVNISGLIELIHIDDVNP